MWKCEVCTVFRKTFPLDIGRKLNVYKTFRRCPGRLLNVLCTFNLRSVSKGLVEPIRSVAEWYFDQILFNGLISITAINKKQYIMFYGQLISPCWLNTGISFLVHFFDKEFNDGPNKICGGHPSKNRGGMVCF